LPARDAVYRSCLQRFVRRFHLLPRLKLWPRNGSMISWNTTKTKSTRWCSHFSS
jgi:hypothetical protein